jgi:uncharacterized membrane protein
MLDLRLVPDDESGDDKGRGEQAETADFTEEWLQSMLVVRVVVTLLCGVGLYTSLFMLHKSRRAARGELDEPSVVQTPRAHLFGIPNSLLGAIYYPLVGVAVWWVIRPPGMLALLALAVLAAATSAVLAYSLVFVTRRKCPYCMTSHAVNWALLLILCWVYMPEILSRGI